MGGFQFTQPKRAATFFLSLSFYSLIVSIHAAQAGCDWHAHYFRHVYLSFNSRSPRGLRRETLVFLRMKMKFQFTQPKRAATRNRAPLPSCWFVSIHAAQAGCDGCCKDTTKKRFSQRINRESPYQ